MKYSLRKNTSDGVLQEEHRHHVHDSYNDGTENLYCVDFDIYIDPSDKGIEILVCGRSTRLTKDQAKHIFLHALTLIDPQFLVDEVGKMVSNRTAIGVDDPIFEGMSKESLDRFAEAIGAVKRVESESSS